MNPLMQAFVGIGADLRDFFRGMFQVNQHITQVGQGFQGLEGIATRVFAVIAAAATAVFIGMAAQFETVQMRYEVLLGSTREAEAIIERLSKFAIKTPFEMPEINRATQSMLTYGFTVEEAYSSLNLLGDIAATTGGDVAGLANLFARMRVTNRAMTEDLNMLTYRSINVYKLLGDRFGVTAEQVRLMAADGKIRFNDIYEVMLKLATGTGPMANGMERLAGTYEGLTSTMRDAWRYVGKEIGEMFLPLARDIVRMMIVVADYSLIITRSLREWSASLGDWPAKILASSVAAFAMAQAFMMLAPVLATVAGSMAWMVTLPIGAFIASWRVLFVVVLGLGNALRTTGVVAAAFFVNWTASANLARIAMAMLHKNVMTFATQGIASLRALASTYMTVGYAARAASAMIAAATAATGWGLLIVGIGLAVTGVVAFGKAVVNAIDPGMWKQLLATLSFVWQAFKNLLSILSESSGLAGAMRRIGDLIRGIMNGVTTGIGSNWDKLVKTVFLLGAGVALVGEKMAAMLRTIGGPVGNALAAIFGAFSSKTLAEDFAGMVDQMVTAVIDFALEVVIWTLIIVDNWKAAWTEMGAIADQVLAGMVKDPNSTIGQIISDVRELVSLLRVMGQVANAGGVAGNVLKAPFSAAGQMMSSSLAAPGAVADSTTTVLGMVLGKIQASMQGSPIGSQISKDLLSYLNPMGPTTKVVQSGLAGNVLKAPVAVAGQVASPAGQIMKDLSIAANPLSSGLAASAATKFASWMFGMGANAAKTMNGANLLYGQQAATANRQIYNAPPSAEAKPTVASLGTRPTSTPSPERQREAATAIAAAMLPAASPSPKPADNDKKILTDAEKAAAADQRRASERAENDKAFRQSMGDVRSILATARDENGRFDMSRAIEAARRMREELRPPKPKDDEAKKEAKRIEAMMGGRSEFVGLEQAIKDIQTKSPNEVALDIAGSHLEVSKGILENSRQQTDALLRLEKKPSVAVAGP